MNKLTLASTILAALSLSACSASNSLAKIDSDFGSLDNDNDGYISKTEADDDVVCLVKESLLETHFTNVVENTEKIRRRYALSKTIDGLEKSVLLDRSLASRAVFMMTSGEDERSTYSFTRRTVSEKN